MPLRWDDDSSPHDDLPWSAHNAETGILSVNNRTSRNAGRIKIAPGTHLIFDFGVLFEGYIRFHPKFTAKVLPVHEGMPDRPDDADFKPAIQMQLLVETAGMTFFTTTSAFNINALNRHIGVFRRAPQAIAGQLPIYKLLRSEAIVWGDGTFSPIVLEQVSWTDRDEGVFGARIVPPPRGRGAAVIGFTPPPLLPGTTDPSLAAPVAPPPAAAAPRSVAVPAAAAAAPASAPPAFTAPAPAPVAAKNPEVPFDGSYTAKPPDAAPPAAPLSPAASPVADPFSIFRRNNNPTLQPIPQPRPAA